MRWCNLTWFFRRTAKKSSRICDQLVVNFEPWVCCLFLIFRNFKCAFGSFLSCLLPLWQNESLCETVFHLHVHFSCNPAKVLTHCHIKVFAPLTSIKFGREWGYFYLLSGSETGMSFDGIRVLLLYKRLCHTFVLQWRIYLC